MPNKPTRVQFPKGAKAAEIHKKIKEMHDAWAQRNPELAHKLYPQLYPAPPKSDEKPTE